MRLDAEWFQSPQGNKCGIPNDSGHVPECRHLFKAGVFRMEVPFHSKRSVDSAMLQSSEEAAMHSKIASSMGQSFQ